MKLRNKETGEIVERIDLVIREEGVVFNTDEQYTSLAELNSEWEDVPEGSKRYWCIDWTEDEGIYYTEYENAWDDFNKQIGNYFETKEEAKKAVEKLKALKRLRDKGLEFFNNKTIGEYGNVSYTLTHPVTNVEEKDLDLLFSQEDK